MSVARLLRPPSIAIVGASDKIGPGLNAWPALQRVGYAGRIYLVTPSRPELFGQATYPALDAITGPIDTVFTAVPQAALVDAFSAAAVRADFQDEIALAEINCLGVLERGPTALDCAMVPRETGGGGTRRPERAANE